MTRVSSLQWIALLLASCACAPQLCAAPPDSYNVVWNSPSTDHHGSMPLGNGDIAANTWITHDGTLHLYISKTDAWDDNARLLKVGKVCLRFEPPLAMEGFRQELKLAEGCVEIRNAEGKVIRAWIDANAPVVQVTAEGPQPFEATAEIQMWRTNRQEVTDLQVSDVMMNRKNEDKREAETITEPDTLLTNQKDRIGWYHRNIKSVGPGIMAEIQGLTGFKQEDPLLHRTFGAVITAEKGRTIDDMHLRSQKANSHRFNIYVLTRHPASPEEWLADMDRLIKSTEKQSFAARAKSHQHWWSQFWDRSWIRATRNSQHAAVIKTVPVNKHPVAIGVDQTHRNRFSGELGRVTILGCPLRPDDIAALASIGREDALTNTPSLLFSGTNLVPKPLSGSADWRFERGFSIEAWVKPESFGPGGARIVDKTTPGVNDGFLFDTYPSNSLRLICGEILLTKQDVLPAGQWTHVAAVVNSSTRSARIYVNGKVAAETTAQTPDDAEWISQMYHLQRYVTACAGRGAYPIKFNGSIFTVPPGPEEKDPDYRRWGPGYWWQNTRLPYISLCTSGDFDLQQPLFTMYSGLLPLCKYRTQHYLGHRGAYYPECIMFWGAVFSETYGWTPFEQREDKLQESGWHKWEWVGGLELAWMMLDYYDHTLDKKFLRETALPMCRETLTFFNEHYPTNEQGEMVMHPSQSLETWWRCTNAIPELAGCKAVAERLLRMNKMVSATDRHLYTTVLAKLPPIPLREIEGKRALAPAQFWAEKRNIENPELYPVFPFRLYAFNKPDLDLALTALQFRTDRGHNGWRQDDILMAYLGMTEEARKGLVGRARLHDANERFPAFWGPNFDWTPDQDHGGVLMKTFQSMLLQTEGDKIFLLPAWPKDWDVEFKLHAPRQTIIEGTYRDGKMELLKVTPSKRRADVTILSKGSR